ncbi:blood group Rh(CE) polypeptide [Sus scrofa]|uniref:Rh blood group CcEe antigens n=3 Tax=Sus scrofa TaxID=9823 RepID=Q8SQH4_PIG|nr:blood group Rh(CE) polypeptide [Sus scrofa]BAB84562.1 Rh protein [Sus scrofa]
MGSKYQRSVRGCLPPWILTLEVILFLVFFFFTSYDTSSKAQKEFLGTYQGFQDVVIIAALGLGFLNTSLRRHCWSSVAFNLFLLALGVQLTLLLDGFLSPTFSRKMSINLTSIQRATVSATSVLISAGAILGKVNLVQLVFMTVIEVTAFSTTRMVAKRFLNVDNHVNMMYIHVFAAYFGLTVSCCLPRPLPTRGKEKDQTATSPSLFAMLGTLFLWMFWPSFNSALLDIPDERKKAIFNTYYALAVSAVTAISMSALIHPKGKINMTHIHNAVLAGGVAMGIPCYLIHSPWLAMVLGFIAGLISIGGAKILLMCLQHKPDVFGICNIYDTYGVHYTFGLPGLLGGITDIVLKALQVKWTEVSMIGYQILTDLGVLSFVIVMGVAFGLLTGFLLNLNWWKPPSVTNYFNDQTFWKFPHLAAGY